MIEDIFKAIRESQLLGKGSLSSIDECMTDEELREDIKEGLEGGTFKTVQGAIDWYIHLESIFWERNGMYDTEWHKADDEREKAGRKCYGV